MIQYLYFNVLLDNFTAGFSLYTRQDEIVIPCRKKHLADEDDDTYTCEALGI